MLYLVPTPVGNLEDITLRALRVLREADLIACEDTRTSGVLLNHYDIETPRTSYHDHNERRKAPHLVAQMQAGTTVALITDAGTPGISDPGFYLVRACIRAGVPVQALPGPTALVPALALSGLPTDQFAFVGFLPAKKGRQTMLRALAEETRTLVLYESPHRLVKTLGQLAEALGPDRPAVVVRELSKAFEETRRGTLTEVRDHFAGATKVRGEIVLLVGSAQHTAASLWSEPA
ncbi:MAG: 16S rRNA (cytidine(1402)-2'-O)-methyltransferase [Bacteroidota bacterium]